MQLNITLALLIAGCFAQLKAQTVLPIVNDSVRYEGKLYSFTWNDGYQRGIRDGSSNNYRLQENNGTYQFREHSGNTSQVADDWGKGYIKGYPVGYKQYLSSYSRAKDSILYEEKMVSRKWYDNNISYETAMMPGFSYNMLFPNNSDSLGFFQGLGIEYLFYAKVSQNDKPGPSHVRFYGRLNILNSSRKDIINDAFAYTLGLDLSLEKNPKRSFLVPYFGIEAGGISQKQLGNTLQFTPTFGIHLLSRKNIFASVQGGYMYPVSNFEELRGYTAQASINVALW